MMNFQKYQHEKLIDAGHLIAWLKIWTAESISIA